jgi:hypothetical protein
MEDKKEKINRLKELRSSLTRASQYPYYPVLKITTPENMAVHTWLVLFAPSFTS